MCEKPYFRYTVSLRIACEDILHDSISDKLGLQNCSFRNNQVWRYKIEDPDSKDLNEQLVELWDRIKEHKEYLLMLKKKYEIDIFCSYTSDCDHAGVDLKPEALRIFSELNVNFGLSIVVI